MSEKICKLCSKPVFFCQCHEKCEDCNRYMVDCECDNDNRYNSVDFWDNNEEN